MKSIVEYNKNSIGEVKDIFNNSFKELLEDDE